MCTDVHFDSHYVCTIAYSGHQGRSSTGFIAIRSQLTLVQLALDPPWWTLLFWGGLTKPAITNVEIPGILLKFGNLFAIRPCIVGPEVVVIPMNSQSIVLTCIKSFIIQLLYVHLIF